MDRVLALPRLQGAIFYGVYHGTQAYQAVTNETIRRALDLRAPERDYKVTIFIDGLHRSERRGVGVGLRQAGIPTRKVRSSRDQADALGRLADAMAGFIRDGTEGVEAFVGRLRIAREGKWIQLV